MLVFTVCLFGAGKTSASLIITYPPHLAASLLPALGVATAQAADLSSQDRYALRKRYALAIPPADFVYYLDVDTGSGQHLRLFQAHYTLRELSDYTWVIISSLLFRARSIVLWAPPMDRLDEDVLNPLLIRLRQLGSKPKEVAFTVCTPTEEGLPLSQQQMLNHLESRRILQPNYFGLQLEACQDSRDAYWRACANFWSKAQGEFGALQVLKCASGDVSAQGYSKQAGVFQSYPWDEFVDLPQRRAIQMACNGDVDSLVSLQADKKRRNLLLSTLMQVVLHGDDVAQRVSIVSNWNAIDSAVGTDWLIPLLADDAPQVRQAVSDTVSARLPKSVAKLVDMVLDSAADRYGDVRRTVVYAADERIVSLLIEALSSTNITRRKNARNILLQLSLRSYTALTTRMQGGAYRGRIGAASILAQRGDKSAQHFLESELCRTRPGSGKRQIVQEEFEAWNPQMLRRLIEEDTWRRYQTAEERKGQLRSFFVSGWFGAVLGSGIFWIAGQVVLRGVMDSHEPYDWWYGVSSNPAILAGACIACGALVGLVLFASFRADDKAGRDFGGAVMLGSIMGGIAGLIIGVALMIDVYTQQWSIIAAVLCFPFDVIMNLGMYGKAILTGGVAGGILGLVLGILMALLGPSSTDQR